MLVQLFCIQNNVTKPKLTAESAGDCSDRTGYLTKSQLKHVGVVCIDAAPDLEQSHEMSTKASGQNQITDPSSHGCTSEERSESWKIVCLNANNNHEATRSACSESDEDTMDSLAGTCEDDTGTEPDEQQITYSE